MKKIILRNRLNTIPDWSAIVEDDQVQSWIDSEVNSRPWCKLSHWSLEAVDYALATREVEDSPAVVEEIDELGNITKEAEPAVTHIEYLHPDSYSVEIIDLESNYEWLLSECHRKRKAEYPQVQDYLDGVVKNDQVQIDSYIAACLAVKAKYPKP